MLLGLLLAAVAGCSPVDHLRARLALRDGNLAYLRHDYALAVQCYDTALRLRPAYARVQLNRGYAFVSLLHGTQDPTERRRLATEGVQSFEAYLDAHGSAASAAGPDAPPRDRIEQYVVTLYLESQQQDAAAKVLQAQLERDPRNPATLQMLASLAAERGDLAAALAWHRRRVEAEPQSVDARRTMAAFAWQMSYRDPTMAPARRDSILDEGISVLQPAIAQKPDDSDSLVYMGLLLREKAKYASGEAARDAFMNQAKSLHDRAMELRNRGKTPADSTAARAPRS